MPIFRHTTSLRDLPRDGTSQHGRALPALDPAHAPLDDRGDADLIRFVQAFARRVRYMPADGGEPTTWASFAEGAGLTAEQIAAWVEDPQRLPEQASWLARPHFVLLLTFIRLLRHAREQLNGVTGRHLDRYYREVLGAAPLPPEPDHVAVTVRLASRVGELLLPAGTALDAGRDDQGRARVYRTERDVLLSRARVAALRSMLVARTVTGIPDARADANLTAAGALDATLRIALGSPTPGAPVPPWRGAEVDTALLVGLTGLLAFAPTSLRLPHHDLRTLARRRRRAAAALADGVQVDAEWGEVNRRLERAGRRLRDDAAWELAPVDPTDFDTNVATALGAPAWPGGCTSIEDYDALLRALEVHFSMPVEHLSRLAAFAVACQGTADALSLDWSEVDRLLADAHAERARAARRAELDAERAGGDDVATFDRLVTAVLRPGQAEPLDWETVAWPALVRHLGVGSCLRLFRAQLSLPPSLRQLAWADALRELESLERSLAGTPTPVARRVEWRGVHALEDTTTARPDPDVATRWRPFGAATPASAVGVGFAVESPVLALAEGVRKVTLTLGFTRDGFAPTDLLSGLGLDSPAGLLPALHRLLQVEVSTAKGWSPVVLTAAVLDATAGAYWTLRGLSAPAIDRPALQLRVALDATHPPVVPPAGGELPAVRLTIRPGAAWAATGAPLESLRIAAAHLAVQVEGLTTVSLQQDDRRLDPRRPWEPWGGQPSVGSRLHLWHPELVAKRLDAVSLDLTWVGVGGSVSARYAGYPGSPTASSLRGRLRLVDRGVGLPLLDAPLFTDDSGARGLFVVSDVGAALELARPGHDYAAATAEPRADLRDQPRRLELELTPRDFGHAEYPAVAARKARDLAVKVAAGAVDKNTDPEAWRVDPPYTPTVARLEVQYQASAELVPGEAAALLHVHPFGVARVPSEAPWLFPRYDGGGELYVGITDLTEPRRLSLLLQVAEGTSDPDAEPAPVRWSALDGDTWRPVAVRHDATRGLSTSGIVEIDVPVTRPGRLLPAGLTWLRVSGVDNPAAVCDLVDVRAQAVEARGVEGGGATLAPGTIRRPVAADGRIAAIEQPFSSFGGRGPEESGAYRVRVSEGLRHRGRALAPWDYERLVLARFGQIYKVRCLPARSEGRVDVIVIPDVRGLLPRDALAPRAPASLLGEIEAYLRAHAPPAATVRVRNARYVPIRIRLGVHFRADVDEGHAKRRLADDLTRFLSPWAWDDGAEIVIGGQLYAASIVDFADRRDYVDFVSDVRLFRGREDGSWVAVPRRAGEDYAVAADAPDEVLVSARDHVIDVVTEHEFESSPATGIGFYRIELDFIVGD